MKGRQSGMPEEEYWNSFFNPNCILSKLGCYEQCGDVVEFGCGYGSFTEAAAKTVDGCVFALDIEQEMIEATENKLKQAGIANVIVERRDFVADGSGRPDASVGYAMLFNILHIEEPVALLREARRVLNPGGKVGVIHWNYDATTPRGPSMDIRPRPEQVRGWLEDADFQDIRFEPLECCPYHYGFVASKLSE
ncbi:methyltransferase domain-containing protein [bacterium]|nr:methyltransferase domain-containing protein [bacterium]